MVPGLQAPPLGRLIRIRYIMEYLGIGPFDGHFGAKM
jgi:hypothetical protein